MNQESSEESSNSPNLLLKKEKYQYPFFKGYFHYPDSYILMQSSEVDRAKRILKIVEENYSQPTHKNLTMAAIHRRLFNIPKNKDYRCVKSYMATSRAIMVLAGLQLIYKNGEKMMDGPFLMIHDTHVRQRRKSNLSMIKTSRFILPWKADYKL